MKTIEIQIYKFAELSEDAQKTAISIIRNEGVNVDFIYDDAYQTVKKACDLFGIKEGRSSCLDCSMDHIDDNILNLKGLRLRTYILNNFELWKGKYYNVNLNKPVKHKRVTSQTFKNGNTHVAYYSAIQKTNSCILTGVCYDDDFLQPVYEFLDWKLRPDYNTYMDFETLMNECFENLRKSIESETEYRNSDEAIIEDIEANDFTEDGKLYRKNFYGHILNFDL